MTSRDFSQKLHWLIRPDVLALGPGVAAGGWFFGPEGAAVAGALGVPLAILAVLAVISAYGPVAEGLKAADKAHLPHFSITAILSLVGLVVGGFFGWTLYVGKEKDPLNIPLFANRFYLDDIYQGIVRVCQDFVGMTLDAIDRYAIEPLTTRAPALGALGLGYVMRAFQTGNVQAYAFLFGLGAVVMLWLLVF